MTRAMLPLLLAAFLTLHDAGPTIHGHEEVDSDWRHDTVYSASEGHHAGDGQDDGADTDAVEEPCGVPRLTPTWMFVDGSMSRSMSGDLLAIAPMLAVYAAVSPSMVDHPPTHTPATLRALHEVYRL